MTTAAIAGFLALALGLAITALALSLRITGLTRELGEKNLELDRADAERAAALEELAATQELSGRRVTQIANLRKELAHAREILARHGGPGAGDELDRLLQARGDHPNDRG